MSRSFAQETVRQKSGQTAEEAAGPSPVVLDNRDYAQHQFGLMLFMVSQGIPYFVLINVRFMVAGAYVPPYLDVWLGALLPTILLWAGAPAPKASNSANVHEHRNCYCRVPMLY